MSNTDSWFPIVRLLIQIHRLLPTKESNIMVRYDQAYVS